MEVAGVVLLELDALRCFARVEREGLQFFEQVLDLLLIVLGDDGWLLGCLLLLSLDFDVAGNEGDGSDFPSGFGHAGFVLLHGYVEHSRVDVGSGLDELGVDRVVEIEFQRSGNSLEATPEKLFGLLDDVIGWEGVE